MEVCKSKSYMPGRPRTEEDARREFWERVDVRDPDECWPWKCPLGSHGRGQFRFNGKPEPSSRMAFYFTHGYMPEVGRHTCDFGPCCNPAHIVDGTQRDNLQDARDRGRMLPPPPMRGEEHYKAKITEDQVRQIRSLRSTGLTHREISDLMGTPFNATKDAANGKTWRHVR